MGSRQQEVMHQWQLRDSGRNRKGSAPLSTDLLGVKDEKSNPPCAAESMGKLDL